MAGERPENERPFLVRLLRLLLVLPVLRVLPDALRGLLPTLRRSFSGVNPLPTRSLGTPPGEPPVGGSTGKRKAR